MKLIFLVVGLGNPGPEYALTRHNVGFLAVDATVRHHDCPPYQEKFQGHMTRLSYTLKSGEACDILFLKPSTFMNLSGRSVQAAMQFYKIPLSRVVVIHDDLDLEPGQVKVKWGGGNGGHNGLKSIDECVGKDYLRVRIGIGHPGHKDLVSPYVLGTFKKTDHSWLEPLIWTLGRLLPDICMNPKDANSEKNQLPSHSYAPWLNAFHTTFREEESRMS